LPIKRSPLKEVLLAILAYISYITLKAYAFKVNKRYYALKAYAFKSLKQPQITLKFKGLIYKLKQS
jgi:hypothetical protein